MASDRIQDLTCLGSLDCQTLFWNVMSTPGTQCPHAGPASPQVLSPCHDREENSEVWWCHRGLVVMVVGFVCRFPHGTGWVPAIVSLPGTWWGQYLLSAHPVPVLATLQGSV